MTSPGTSVGDSASDRDGGAESARQQRLVLRNGPGASKGECIANSSEIFNGTVSLFRERMIYYYSRTSYNPCPSGVPIKYGL